MITRENVEQTLKTLFLAGKKLPDGVDENQLTKFWYDTFKESSLPDWLEATKIAVTMTTAGKINVNILTPALMQEALNIARQNRIDRQITEAKNLDNPIDPTAIVYRTRRFAWLWTRKKFKEKVFFTDILPTPEEVQEKINELKVDNNSDNRVMTKIYLADCKLYGDKMNYEAYKNNNGEVAFRKCFTT